MSILSASFHLSLLNARWMLGLTPWPMLVLGGVIYPFDRLREYPPVSANVP